jgi:hypothetical protein
MLEFKIKEFGPASLVLSRVEPRDPPVQGLSPTESQSIFMGKDELKKLIEVLTEYANKG